MQFYFLLPALTFLASSAEAIRTVKLYALNETEPDVHNQGLYTDLVDNLFESVYLGNTSRIFNTEGKSIYLDYNEEDGGGRLYLSLLSDGYPGLSFIKGGQSVNWTYEEGFLKANGSDGFYACKNTGDEIGYSKNNFQVGLFEITPLNYTDVTKIKIKAVLSN